MADKTVVVHRTGGLHLLTLLFVGLKLTGYIDWPWIWVTAPSWIPLGIVFGMLVFAALCFVAAYVVGGKR